MAVTDVPIDPSLLDTAQSGIKGTKRKSRTSGAEASTTSTTTSTSPSRTTRVTRRSTAIGVGVGAIPGSSSSDGPDASGAAGVQDLSNGRGMAGEPSRGEEENLIKYDFKGKGVVSLVAMISLHQS